MASLLFWWSTDGAPIDDTIWRRMVAQAAKDAGLEKPPETWIEGPNYRALAIRTLRVEPEPVRRIEPGILVLSALRHPMTDREILNPPYEEPAAVICFDEREQRLTLARDLLGQRYLVWTRFKGGIIAATREESILAHPSSSWETDDFHIACRLAYASPSDTTTPFSRIHSVPPASRLTLDFKRESLSRTTPEPVPGLFARRERDLARDFGGLVDQSVSLALRGAQRIGAFFSAGFDSPTVVASMLARGDRSAQPVLVTHGYSESEGADLDERLPAAAIARHWGLEHHTIDAAAVPVTILERDPRSPLVAIMQNFFGPLIDEGMRIFRRVGADVVLNGYGGDDFLYGASNWACSAVQARRWDLLSGGLSTFLRRDGFLRTVQNPAVRRLIKYTLLGRRIFSSIPPPDRLGGEFLLAWKEATEAHVRRFADWPNPAAAATYFSASSSLNRSMYAAGTHVRRIETRSPLVDYQVARYGLSVPSALWTGPEGYKRMLRLVNVGRLPDSWLARRRCGSLAPLFLKAWASQQATVAKACAPQDIGRNGLRPETAASLEAEAVQQVLLEQSKVWRNLLENHKHANATAP